MFKFTTTSFVNGPLYLNGEPSWFTVNGGTITYSDSDAASAKALPTTTDNTTEKSFTVNRNVKFFKDNVTSITKAQFVEPEIAELEIDFGQAALEAGDYRLYLYIRSVDNADPLYANDFVYKGRPLYIEFSAKGNASKDAENFVKTAKKWINLLYANGNLIKVSNNGSKVTVKATSEYQRFYISEIQKYDSNALIWAHDGAFVTLFSSDVNSNAYDEDVFKVVVEGRAGFGTYVQLTKDLRLPTNANTRFFRDKENEMPIITGKYWEYVVTQCTERPEMQGTSVLGQYNKSITTHVIFVENGVQADFDAALAELGVEITEVKKKVVSEQSSEQNSESDEFTPVTYSFTSYNPIDDTEWGTGTVQTTGQTSNGYTEVEVLTNEPVAEFIGQNFWISSNAQPGDNQFYNLYTDAGTTEAGIKVKITQ